MKHIIISALIALAPVTSHASTQCAPHDAAVVHLADKFKETRRMVGLDANGNMFEIFASDNGTWSAVLTTPDGISCMVGSGDNYELHSPLVGDPA